VNTLTRVCIVFLWIAPAVAWSDQYQPDWIIRAGVSGSLPYNTSEPLAFHPGHIDSDWQMSLDDAFAYFGSVSWRNHPNIGINVFFTGPFNHDLRAENGLAGVAELNGRSEDLGDVSLSLISLSIEFYSFDKAYPIQPYVAIGVNKTIFFGERSSLNFDHVLTDALASSSRVESLSIDDSLGLTLGIGVDIDVWRNLGLQFSAMWMDINGGSTITLDDGRSSSLEMSIDPWILNGGLMVRF